MTNFMQKLLLEKKIQFKSSSIDCISVDKTWQKTVIQK